MNISDNGLKFIGDHEGLRLEAYPDPGTGGAPWTVGYGHTGPEVVPGYIVTPEKALEDLQTDSEWAARGVEQEVMVSLTQNQFDALCSLVYNIGLRNFQNSTLLRLLNQGQFSLCAQQFEVWNRAGGKVMPGLTARRADEKALFLTPDPS